MITTDQAASDHISIRSVLLGIVVVMLLVVSACSQSDTEDAKNFLATRPGIGITAAGGVVSDGPACPKDVDAQSPKTIKLAWTSRDINAEQLAAIGLETLDLDNPEYIVEAYVNSVNNSGGLGGRCVLLIKKIGNINDKLWHTIDTIEAHTVEEYERICDELPKYEPVMFMGLALYDTDLECLTIGEQVPTVGMSTWLPNSEFVKSEGLLFVNHGSEEFLVATAIDAAFQAGELTRDDLITTLHKENTSHTTHNKDTSTNTVIAIAIGIAEKLGLETAEPVLVPQDFGQRGVLIWERRVRLLENGLTEDEQDEVNKILDEEIQDNKIKQILMRMQDYYMGEAERLKSAGVTAVVATDEWSDVRRMMRAAEQVEWFPKWIISDIQPPLLVLTGTPKRQALNLIQISNERAAGDEIPEMDHRCVSLRNTIPDVPAFAYRPHTDAWNLMLNICDYLDVVFSTISRVQGTVTRKAILQELQNTDYQTQQGSLIKFSADDPYGIDVFRILKADPDCILNDWGCMRAETEWTDVATTLNEYRALMMTSMNTGTNDAS